MPEQLKTPPGQEAERLAIHYDTRLPKLTPLQRALIPIIGWVVWAVVRLLGPTIRFEVLGGAESGARLPSRPAAEYLRLLAPLHHSGCLVLPKPRRRAYEHDEFRWAVDPARN